MSEVAVLQGGNDQHVSRRQGAQEFVEVEGNVLEAASIAGERRHVEGLAPALLGCPVLLCAAVVIEERVEPAARDDDADPFVEKRGEDRIVPAEGMADRSKS